jgi:hypothetical protein
MYYIGTGSCLHFLGTVQKWYQYSAPTVPRECWEWNLSSIRKGRMSCENVHRIKQKFQTAIQSFRENLHLKIALVKIIAKGKILNMFQNISLHSSTSLYSRTEVLYEYFDINEYQARKTEYRTEKRGKRESQILSFETCRHLHQLYICVILVHALVSSQTFLRIS